MATALMAPTRVASLGILDVAPVYDALPPNVPNPRGEILKLIKLMNSVPLHALQDKQDVGKWIKEKHERPMSNVDI